MKDKVFLNQKLGIMDEETYKKLQRAINKIDRVELQLSGEPLIGLAMKELKEIKKFLIQVKNSR